MFYLKWTRHVSEGSFGATDKTYIYIYDAASQVPPLSPQWVWVYIYIYVCMYMYTQTPMTKKSAPTWLHPRSAPSTFWATPTHAISVPKAENFRPNKHSRMTSKNPPNEHRCGVYPPCKLIMFREIMGLTHIYVNICKQINPKLTWKGSF